MTGGGFGGCVVALADVSRAPAVAREAAAAYHAATRRRPDVHVCSASDGATCTSV